jgi:hypothetical protein
LIGQAACTNCPAGTALATTTGNDAATDCTSCGAGTWSSAGAGTCTNCLAGTYSTRTGSTSIAVCTPCTYGWTSAAGSTSVAACNGKPAFPYQCKVVFAYLSLYQSTTDMRSRANACTPVLWCNLPSCVCGELHLQSLRTCNRSQTNAAWLLMCLLCRMRRGLLWHYMQVVPAWVYYCVRAHNRREPIGCQGSRRSL